MLFKLTDIVRSDGSLNLNMLPPGKRETRYISVSGQEGSGKSTLRDDLANHYNNKRMVVITAKSPCDQHLIDLLNNAISQNGYQDWYTEQLLFSFSDGLLSNYMMQLDGHCDYFICQRGPVDQYNNGVVRSGLSYRDINNIQKPDRLAKFDVYFHLNCDVDVAWERIRDNLDGNRYQFPQHIVEEGMTTERLPLEISVGTDPALEFLRDSQHYYINTTELSVYNTFQKALKCLGER